MFSQMNREHRSNSQDQPGIPRFSMTELAVGKRLTVKHSLELLGKYGIKLNARLVTSKEEAIAEAKKISESHSCNLVLKVATQKKQKAASGFIKFDVRLDDVGKTFDELKEKCPDAEGILVMPMAKVGLEIMVGARMTEYGIAIVIGAGGTESEKIKDVQICINPQSREDILKKIEKLKMAPLLMGKQGLPAVNSDELADMALALARLVRDNPDYEVDLNPVRIRKGYMEPLDFRIVPNENLVKAPELVVGQEDFNNITAKGLNPKSIVFVGASDKVFGITKEGNIVAVEKVTEPHQDCKGIIPTMATIIIGKNEKGLITKELVVGEEVEIVDTPHKTLATNVLNNFKGETFLVSRAPEVLDQKTYASVKELPSTPDVAVILVKAEDSIEVLEECGRKGIKFIVMENSGFKEIGNKELEERLLEVINRYKMVVIGPNGIGVYKPDSGLDLTFLAEDKNKRMQGGGGISVFSQSGSLVSIHMEDEAEVGGKVNAFLSVGNMSGVTNTQLLRYFAQDKSTKVIGIVAEGIPDGEEFMRAAKEISKEKPIVVLKLGKSGSEKTTSHTGALAGDYASFLTAAEESGIVVTDNINQFWLACKMLEKQPLPKAEGVAVITNAGGQLSQMFDELHAAGLKVAKLESATKDKVEKIVSKNVTVSDAAIDLAADSNPVVLSGVLEAFKEDKNVGTLVVMTFFQPPTMTPLVVGHVLEQQGEKPMCVVLNNSAYATERRGEFEAGGIPTNTNQADTVAVIKAFMGYAKWRREAVA